MSRSPHSAHSGSQVNCPLSHNRHQFNNAANTCSDFQNFANAAFIIGSKLKIQHNLHYFLLPFSAVKNWKN